LIQLDILRHGACQGGEIFRGSTDVALSETGWTQMHAAVDRFVEPPWQAIVSSPLQRCRLFAQAQAERMDLPLLIDEDWRELSFGQWEGRLRETLWQENPSALEAFYRDPVGGVPPGGEPANVMQERVVAAYQRCLKDASGQRILVVTHGGVIRALLAHILGLSLQRMFTLDVPYACMSGIHYAERYELSRLKYHNPQADETDVAPVVAVPV
jgi:alpha-ribazole phosphatase